MVLVFICFVIIFTVTLAIVLAFDSANIEVRRKNEFQSDIRTYKYNLDLFLMDQLASGGVIEFPELLCADSTSITYCGWIVGGNIYDIIPSLRQSKERYTIKITDGKLDITGITDKRKYNWALEVLGDNVVSIEN